jgi:hypothetical protein
LGGSSAAPAVAQAAIRVRSKVMLEHELQRIYESEISVLISWLWDGGIDVRLEVI